MLFYEAVLMIKKKPAEQSAKRPIRKKSDVEDAFNRQMQLDDENYNGEIIRAAGANGSELTVICAFRHEDFSLDAAAARVLERAARFSGMQVESLTAMKEITASEMLKRDESSSFSSGFHMRGMGNSGRFSLDYFSNSYFKVSDYIIKSSRLSRKAASEEGKKLMLGADFEAELDRIYSRLNKKKFYGHPVHYKITAGSSANGREAADILIRALKANGRLAGSRVSVLHSLQYNCVNEDEMEDLFSAAAGTAVIIDLTSDGSVISGGGDDEDIPMSFASMSDDDARFVASVAAKYKDSTLCVFIENSGSSTASAVFWRALPDSMKLVEFSEGFGSRADAAARISVLAKRAGMEEFMPDDAGELLPSDRVSFTISEAERVFEAWRTASLSDKIYRSYGEASFMEIEKTVKRQLNSREALRKMIGLDKVKEVAENIIAAHKIGAMRKNAGLETNAPSRHMVFTGSPGTAKTTVARLLAGILKEESVLSTGVFVECGRSDLVGRYVGWTAKTVKEKFRKARGGVLFIDEAYSLVDDSRSFGDEAINTIVQEMENSRGELLVIFAGYPDKMREFLDRNEGLRSRVAFHLDFPDYTVSELTEILRLMASERSYKLTAEAERKCVSVFERAVAAENFGNGRFVRNLLEQAVIRQASRLITAGSDISREELELLLPDDFDTDISVGEGATRRVGFAA